MTDEAVKTVEHYIEGPRKPVLQEKQVFLVCTIWNVSDWPEVTSFVLPPRLPSSNSLEAILTADRISSAREGAWRLANPGVNDVILNVSREQPYLFRTCFNIYYFHVYLFSGKVEAEARRLPRWPGQTCRHWKAWAFGKHKVGDAKNEQNAS